MGLWEKIHGQKCSHEYERKPLEMDEKLREFNNAVTTQVSRYRMIKRDNPCYLIVNENTLQQLRRSYLTSFSPDGDYFNGMRVLVDNTLNDFIFRVVGE